VTPRERVVIAVAGTGTEVGKTFVTAALARALLAQGITVAARKPVLSYAAADASTDADLLAAATGEDADVVCPPQHRLALPMAPPMAAAALGLPPFTIAELAASVRPAPQTVTLVETAGGVRSPIAADGDTRDVIDALAATLVVLVADAGLGTINLVRMSLDALGGHDVCTILNRYDPSDDLHCRNAEWLRTETSADVVTSVDALARRVRAVAGS
jgi:dethiobiotin synthetase